MTHSSFCQFHSDSFKKPENRTIWLDATICFNSPSSSSVLLLSLLSECPCKAQVSVFELYKYHDKFSRVFTQGSLGMFSMAFHSTKKVKKLRLRETFRQLCSSTRALSVEEFYSKQISVLLVTDMSQFTSF